jgi:hypothetical protein
VLHDAVFDLRDLHSAMASMRLAVVSPSVAGASRLAMTPLSERHKRQNWATRRVRFEQRKQCLVRRVKSIETFAVMFSRAAWLCFASMFDDAVLHNESAAVGWGYDLCYLAHCAGRGNLGLGRMGIVTNQIAIHTEAGVGELGVRLASAGAAHAWLRAHGAVAQFGNATSQHLGSVLAHLGDLSTALLDASSAASMLEEELQLVRAKVPAPERGRRLSLALDSNIVQAGLAQAKRLSAWVASDHGRECIKPRMRSGDQAGLPSGVEQSARFCW